MRTPIVLSIAAAAFIALSTLPAAATDMGQAVALCGKNPKCSVNKDASGGAIIDVAGGGAVYCPPKGACTVVDHGPARTKGTSNSGKINGIVSGTVMNKPERLSGTAAKPQKIRSTEMAKEHPSIANGSGNTKKH